MSVPAIILERVETFGRNLESYLSSDYKEAQLRREFLDPLFESLGWDVQNRLGYAEAYKDVVHEDSLKIGSSGTSAPDYSFRIGGTRKFFIEAKKPSVYLKDNSEPAAQLRRYSWSAKLQLGIVTDFQEFAIYDTRIRPREGDKASTARIFYCTFEQYAEKWDEIAGIFSRESVLRGSFDRYAAVAKGKRGTAEFDDAFLEDLEMWRKRLAENLALRNRALTQRELNFAVQRTLDRIIFLRIAEDRGIEPYRHLQALTAGENIYPRLCEIFEKADLRYNSGLFHFAAEKGRDESPDRLTLGLELDDAVLKEILAALYYPKSPYAFAVIPAEILGHVYEQFLGNVIYLTEGHRAHVDKKPEVRKSGGVYYTPGYIVNYIVRQTIGPLIEGRTPKQVEKLRVLDPACGSGSFLLGAYEFLLDWHLRYYLANDPGAWAQKKKPPIYETSPNAGRDSFGQIRNPESTIDNSRNWQLTTAERKRILTANLYGVDIDAQAVEVTKLSLLLKVLEGEARELQGKQLDFHRVLPDLGHNIKCGNSLISSDFYRQPALPEFDDDARYKINAFDWKEEFGEIMNAGGFDAVVGNPPYILLQDELRDESQLDYFSANFSVSSFKVDTYHLFFERGLQLISERGRLGFITPSNYLTNNHLTALRRLLLTKAQPIEIVAIDGEVFQGASVDTAVMILQRSKAVAEAFRVRRACVAVDTFAFGAETEVKPALALKDKHVLLTGTTSTGSDPLWKKCQDLSSPLGDIAFVNFGKQLRDRKRFTNDVIEIAAPRSLPTTHRPCLTGRDISRYSLSWGKLACLDDTVAQSGGCWDAARHQAKNKLLTRQIGRTPVFAIDRQGFDCLNTVFMVNAKDSNYSPEYLIGVLNSRLLAFLWLERFYDKRGTFPKIKGTYLKLLPIRKLNPDSESSIAKEAALAKQVERMQKLHTDFAAAKSPDAQTRLERDIAATDRAIDQLVYQLYDLTPEEIALVEKVTAPTAPATGTDVKTTETPAATPVPSAANYAQAEADAAHFYSATEEEAKM